MIKYVFKEPLTIQNADKADPQKIGEALAKLSAKAGGKLTPPAVVEAARDQRHILHRHFEWDDAVAASKFRLDQARALIRAVRVEDSDMEDGHAPAFISINDRAGTAYRSLKDVKESVDLQASVMAAARRDLEAWQTRYRSLKEVCEVVERAKELLERKLERAKQKKSDDETRPQA